MRGSLSWYAGCLIVAWGLLLAAVIATVTARDWAGNDCQPVPQPTSEKVAESSAVLAIVVTLAACFAAVIDKKDVHVARRAIVTASTLAMCVLVLLLEYHHAPACPPV